MKCACSLNVIYSLLHLKNKNKRTKQNKKKANSIEARIYYKEIRSRNEIKLAEF